MKKLHYYSTVALISFLVLTIGACRKSFLEIPPQGTLNEQTLSTKAGLEQLLIGAYSALRQTQLWPGNYYYSSVDYYILSGIASDEAIAATRGNLPDLEQFDGLRETPVNSVLEIKWGNLYSAIQRANDVLRLLPKVKDISTDEATQIKAEAIFLRAFFHFQVAKVWGKHVPYVNDSISFKNNNYLVSNATSIWPKIETDFKFAIANLSPTKSEVGRPNSWAAKCFLAATYMFEDKYNEAKPLLGDIITNGITSSGEKYALVSYPDNFNNPTAENNAESIFAIQFTAHDGSNGWNGNMGDLMNQPMVAGYGGGGTFQASFSLVNSFKTNPVTGLPLIYTFNDTNMKNDQGIPASEPFTPYAGTVDPRLDWTVCRRGIPALDWGIFGPYWVYDQSIGGPYAAKKSFLAKANEKDRTNIGWIYTSNLNREVMRFARILLFAAEVQVETGSLDKAEMYVNRVRARAADPTDWVHTYVDNNDPSRGFTKTPAANYKVGLYPPGYFEMKGKDFARDAVHFEEKIELAMEGFRFFDLRRWDNGTGSMANTMNAFFEHERNVPNFTYTAGLHAKFLKGKDELYPIPQQEIDRSKKNGESTLKQNPGW